MAGDEGLEPPNGGVKVRCLTTWRIPNELERIAFYEKSYKVKGKCRQRIVIIISTKR